VEDLMTKTKLALIAFAAVFVVGGISSALEEEPTTEPVAASSPSPEPGKPAPTEAAPTKAAAPTQAAGPEEIDVDVPWDNYAPSVRTRIDEAYAGQDCAALQQEFDTAADNNDAQRIRTGEGNDDLLEYLDVALEQAGCYE
jgi:hypothetical protein